MWHRGLRLLGLALWTTVATRYLSIGHAAQPPDKNEAFSDAALWPGKPHELFHRLFAEPSEEDQRALAAIPISPREERQIGREALEAYLEYLDRQKIRVVRRGKQVDYLSDLVGTIQPLLNSPWRDRPIQVLVANSPKQQVHVFAGGTVVFFEGLLDHAGSEAAMVGLVGHELSHLDREHLLTRARRWKRLQQSFPQSPGGNSADRFFAWAGSAANYWTHPFQPEQEHQADADGARWAYHAGYDPRELARLFAAADNLKSRWQEFVPAFLQSHPPAASRQAAVLKLYEELQQRAPKEKLYVGRENLRLRIARCRREFPQ